MDDTIKLQLASPQQVWFAWFPFMENPNDGKNRPVLILDVDNETVSVLAMQITSSPPRDEYDIPIDDWSEIPLEHLSTLRPKCVQVINKKQLKRYIGIISDNDWQKATDALIRLTKHVQEGAQ